MAYQLTDIVPWGRSFEEYVAMFALSGKDLRGSILGCADGPASFTCEPTRRGAIAVSAAMQRFLSDFERGRSEGRCRPESLPYLGFEDNRFDLALCSHFLFLCSDRLDRQFHIEAITEMCRVAREARVFSLLQLGSRPSSPRPGDRSLF
jgi:hypothetical protein